MYKLLATDLDGTLLSNFAISERNKIALTRASESGIYIVLCSGRSFMSIDQFVKMLEIKNANDFGICYNGGMVYKTKDFEPLYEVRLKNRTSLEILEHLKSFDNKLELMCYTGNKLNAEKLTEGVSAYSDVAKLPVNITPFENITEDVSKILLWGERSDLLCARESLNEFVNDVSMHFSANKLFEIVDKTVSKGNALKFLGDYLGITSEEIIAVGDNQNDLSMIEYAGLGIAVANAEDEVKNAANYVLESSCDQNALEEVADKFIRGNKT